MKGFRTTGATRKELVLSAQARMFERFGAEVNDLADGDAGCDLEGSRAKPTRKVMARGGAAAGAKQVGGKRKRGPAMVHSLGWSWPKTKKFEIEGLLGRMVADGGDVPGRGVVKSGTVLYKVLWLDFPPEIATWEDEDSVHEDYKLAYEEGLAEEAAKDAADEEEGSDIESDDDE